MNVGDAAILQGELRALREAFGPGVTIEVAEQTPEVARRLYPDVAFHAGLHSEHADWPRWRTRGGIASLRKRRTSWAVRLLGIAPRLARLLLSAEQRAHLDRIAAADAVVATGGTYFVEHYNFRAKADEVLAAQALRRPTFLFTQSLGPFQRATSRSVMRRIVAGCERVFLRDERSREHLVAIGVDAARLAVHADAAFALAEGSTPVVALDAASAAARTPLNPGAARRPRVAISVRSWSHFREGSGDAGARYRHAVADAARTLAREGNEIVFLSTCQGVPEYWADDSRFATQLVDELLPGEPHIGVDRTFHAPEALADALRAFDVAIATRMHFAILALCVGTPVIAIAYEFKSRELLAAMGRAAWAFEIEEVTAGGLVAAVREALAGGPALRQVIRGQVREFRADARRPGERIRAALHVSAGARRAAAPSAGNR